jgi:hypothetical protein
MARRVWPDSEALHQKTDPNLVTVCKMPVIINDMIEEQYVVRTNDQPLGIWHLNGVLIAPVVLALQNRKNGVSPQSCLEQDLGLHANVALGIVRWLYQNNWLPEVDNISALTNGDDISQI